jgi:glycyl-tRNA synthetase beta chain
MTWNPENKDLTVEDRDNKWLLAAKWIRPVRSLLALFGEEILPIHFFGLTASNLTSNKLFSNSLIISNACEYEKLLTQNLIVVNQAQRKQLIQDQIKQELFKNQLLCPLAENDSALLNEIVGLCENPKILVGEIDEKFLNLPHEALVLTLQNNQKYLCCTDLQGNFSKKFLFAIDDLGFDEKSLKKIIADNQKILVARLSDLNFFIEQDLKKPLSFYSKKLDSIIFHQKLGSVAAKVERIKEMAKFLSIFVPHCDICKIEHAGNLAKADLPTKAIAEMPELQGKIGSFYAKIQGENREIFTAIYEHYLPIGLNSELPVSPVGIALAMKLVGVLLVPAILILPAFTPPD